MVVVLLQFFVYSLTVSYSKLEPRLSEAEQYDVIKAATDSVFPLPVMASPSKKDAVVSHVLPMCTMYICAYMHCI